MKKFVICSNYVCGQHQSISNLNYAHDADNIDCSYKTLNKQAFQMIKANLERFEIKTPFKDQVF